MKIRTATAILAMMILVLAPQRASADSSAIEDFFNSWFAMVSQTQSEQPRWITPLVTVTPRLEQELRYDQFFQSASKNGVATDNYGASKGLELIPQRNIELIVGIPGFIARTRPRNTDGFADLPYLIKLRLLSANEDQGNYIVTLFMGATVPTGSNLNGNGHATFTPTIAFGKGLGDFSMQSTVSVTLPSGGLDRLGLPVAYNTAFQYRLFRYFWPELETNYTWFSYGEKNGKSQLFLTPGIIIGRIPIRDRLGLTFGAGVQEAVTRNRTFNHNYILTARLPF